MLKLVAHPVPAPQGAFWGRAPFTSESKLLYQHRSASKLLPKNRSVQMFFYEPAKQIESTFFTKTNSTVENIRLFSSQNVPSKNFFVSPLPQTHYFGAGPEFTTNSLPYTQLTSHCTFTWLCSKTASIEISASAVDDFLKFVYF